jgi:uncharacterized ferritin-like protein (DUF455 family)
MELRAHCLKALAINDLNEKLNQVKVIYESFRSHLMTIDSKADIQHTYHLPGAPLTPQIVAPRLVEKRSTSSEQGKLIFVHALAHIEFSAINLALDIIWRFKDLPDQFYSDWLQIAYEEHLHFNLLNDYLKKFDLSYGSFNAHNSLWEMADRTRHDLIHRLALIPRTMEARGLDVTPPIIEKFKQQKDDDIAAILQIIFEEEIRHVSIGNIWYRWACKAQKLAPHETYKNLLKTYDIELNYEKLNKEARYKAGFLKEELI